MEYTLRLSGRTFQFLAVFAVLSLSAIVARSALVDTSKGYHDVSQISNEYGESIANAEGKIRLGALEIQSSSDPSRISGTYMPGLSVTVAAATGPSPVTVTCPAGTVATGCGFGNLDASSNYISVKKNTVYQSCTCAGAYSTSVECQVYCARFV